MPAVLARLCIVLSVAAATMTATVIADSSLDSEPVLRLRLSDPILDAAPRPTLIQRLRPRLNAEVAAQPASVPMPAVSVEDSGRVGKFAYISTPHPNMVVAIGATEDHTELGRQIDRAMLDMTSGANLYEHAHDSAPFVGLGFRAGAQDRGWAFDATIGAGVINASEDARLANWEYTGTEKRYETEGRANLRLRYKF